MMSTCTKINTVQRNFECLRCFNTGSGISVGLLVGTVVLYRLQWGLADIRKGSGTHLEAFCASKCVPDPKEKVQSTFAYPTMRSSGNRLSITSRIFRNARN